MQGLRSLGLGLAKAVIWPLYLVLLAYAARVAPWPRSVGILVSAITTGTAIAVFIHDLLHWFTLPSGHPIRHLGLPRAMARQLNTGSRFVVVAAAVLLLPAYLFDHELIMPEGKPVAAPATSRLLILGFELVIWGACLRLWHGNPPFGGWLSLRHPSPTQPEESVHDAPSSSESKTNLTALPANFSVFAKAYSAIVWVGKRRRLVAGLVLATVAGIILLDVRGYSFTARRLALGVFESVLAVSLAVIAYRAIMQAISQNAWRWAQTDRPWALALTSAMALRTKLRTRRASTAANGGGSGSASPVVFDSDSDGDVADVQLDDLAAALRRLGAYTVTILTLVAVAWIWEVDMALVQFLLNHPIGSADTPTPVTVGDLAVAATVLLLGGLSWKYMNTLFAITLFPRMPDDPGVRFAVVTLCRYAILGLTTLIAFSAIHLDLAKIGVILAALGVGLGFGLQEVVSNFVCGIILLLERPIRIGDVVTVAGTTGKVDRINIRATAIINSDNQSMIVPNREFITGNLVNWTLKDKILRVPIKMSVAYGTNPDQVVDLLLQIARADADVMIMPAPSAALEGFGDSSLLFALYTYVPDPGLAGNVKHRLCAEIQRRFTQDGIVIPYPTQELHLNNRLARELGQARELVPEESIAIHPYRVDSASKTPPAAHVFLGDAPSSGLRVNEKVASVDDTH